MNPKLLTLVAATVFAAVSVHSQVVYDNADLSAYAPQPTHNWSPINGGSNYNTWTALSDQTGGGTYMEGVGVNGRQVDGNYSFALFAGSGGYDISRPLAASETVGTFSIITRFDVADSPGASEVNLRAGNNLTGFSAGEFLSFGIVNGNQLSYTDGSGFHLMPSGESRGSVWDWTVSFNTVLDTYSLSVTNLGGGFADFVTGSLEAGGSSVGSFAVLNSSTGNNQNVIFDSPEFVAVPEPSAAVLGGIGFAALYLWRRRLLTRRAKQT